MIPSFLCQVGLWVSKCLEGVTETESEPTELNEEGKPIGSQGSKQEDEYQQLFKWECQNYCDLKRKYQDENDQEWYPLALGLLKVKVPGCDEPIGLDV